MRILLCLTILCLLSGCISLGGGAPPQHNTTVVVPPGSTVTCVNHDGTPCQPE